MALRTDDFIKVRVHSGRHALNIFAMHHLRRNCTQCGNECIIWRDEYPICLDCQSVLNDYDHIDNYDEYEDEEYDHYNVDDPVSPYYWLYEDEEE